MKKIVFAIIIVASIVLSVVSVSATELDSSTKESSNYFEVVEEDEIPDNTVRFYKYGKDIDPSTGVRFVDPDGKEKDVSKTFNFEEPSVDLELPNPSGYKLWSMLKDTQGGTIKVIFNSTGGTYQKIRVKLSEYSDYFNDNGTHTQKLIDSVHDYNFTDEGDGIHYSSLIFVSGGAMTAVAPDKDGMAEIYMSTDIGAETVFMTDFVEKGVGSGGGTTGSSFRGFTMGDVDKNGYVTIQDVTLIQKYICDLEDIDELGLHNADTNNDKSVDIFDATKIQKYIVNIGS